MKTSQTRREFRTGIPTLDTILNGGFQTGSIILIEDINVLAYSLQLARSFIGEGQVQGDQLLIYAENSDDFQMPSIKRVKQSEAKPDNSYEGNGGYYMINLQTPEQSPEVTANTITFERTDAYKALFDQIVRDLERERAQKRHTRIYLHSLLSESYPLSISEIFQLFSSLKTLTMSANAVCLISCPAIGDYDVLRDVMVRFSDVYARIEETGEGVYLNLLKIPRSVGKTCKIVIRPRRIVVEELGEILA